jgi:hypothetical protein
MVEHNAKQDTQIFLHDFTKKPPGMQEGLRILTQIFWKCKTTVSYRPNMIASEMYKKLKITRASSPIDQIVQENKCIGFSVDKVFVPCYPSAILPKVPVQQNIPVNKYTSTVQTLSTLSKTIPCSPKYKVVEQGHITGIVLETNAFVPCTRILDYQANLPPYDSTIQYEYDSFPNEEDHHRVQTTHRIKAEKCLYAACRRMLKEILGKNVVLRKEINTLIQEKQVSKMEEKVKQILEPKIRFVDKTDESFIQTQVKCGGCCFAYDRLILPKHNLVSGEPNRYFSRLAEELTYYTRFSTFITSPQLLIPEVPFSVNQDELLLTYSTVHEYYASLMEPKRLPEYYTTFDNANPIPTPYSLTYLKVQKKGMIEIPQF